GTFNNAGTLRKSSPGGQAQVAVAVNNTGLVEVLGGPLFLNAPFVQTAGSTVVGAGNDLLAFQFGLQIQGGELTGNGRVVGAVVNGGTIRPGSGIGTLTITGRLTQTASGTVEIEIGGTTPGTGYDRLTVGTVANLGGTLAVHTVGGFLPDFGDSFDVITF